jgi:hypothetical protein
MQPEPKPKAMTDLAERLRQHGHWLETRSFADLDGSLDREAANEIERLRIELDGARKIACDSCSSDVPLRPDGYHHHSDGSLQWCDARADEENMM